jgi:hypothetical protein
MGLGDSNGDSNNSADKINAKYFDKDMGVLTQAFIRAGEAKPNETEETIRNLLYGLVPDVAKLVSEFHCQHINMTKANGSMPSCSTNVKLRETSVLPTKNTLASLLPGGPVPPNDRFIDVRKDLMKAGLMFLAAVIDAATASETSDALTNQVWVRITPAGIKPYVSFTEAVNTIIARINERTIEEQRKAAAKQANALLKEAAKEGASRVQISDATFEKRADGGNANAPNADELKGTTQQPLAIKFPFFKSETKQQPLAIKFPFFKSEYEFNTFVAKMDKRKAAGAKLRILKVDIDVIRPKLGEANSTNQDTNILLIEPTLRSVVYNSRELDVHRPNDNGAATLNCLVLDVDTRCVWAPFYATDPSRLMDELAQRQTTPLFGQDAAAAAAAAAESPVAYARGKHASNAQAAQIPIRWFQAIHALTRVNLSNNKSRDLANVSYGNYFVQGSSTQTLWALQNVWSKADRSEYIYNFVGAECTAQQAGYLDSDRNHHTSGVVLYDFAANVTRAIILNEIVMCMLERKGIDGLAKIHVDGEVVDLSPKKQNDFEKLKEYIQPAEKVEYVRIDAANAANSFNAMGRLGRLARLGSPNSFNVTQEMLIPPVLLQRFKDGPRPIKQIV